MYLNQEIYTTKNIDYSHNNICNDMKLYSLTTPIFFGYTFIVQIFFLWH